VRGAVADLEPVRSLSAGLPAAFFGNDFTAGLVRAFDEVLAPVFATLEDIDAYLDPRYAPDDFVRWLAGWLGFPTDERWSAERIRTHLGDALEALLWRGTVRGVAAAVRAHTGQEPEVADTGGVSWSSTPLGRLPGRSRGELVVRVPDVDGTVDAEVVDRVVGEVKPAHVPHRVIVS
jgi:phage tail-like protein